MGSARRIDKLGKPRMFFLLTLSLGMLVPWAAAGASKEGRAVWITRWEWTGTRNRSADQYKIRKIFDNLRAGRFNMAFFQVRGQADAFYRSSLEPWAAELTGTLGKDPGWDPLQYAIRIAHERGIELHAWVNVYPMWRGTTPPPHTTPEHIYHLHYPDWVCYNSSGEPMSLNSGYIFVSPGNPEAREHILNVCLDIVSRYDVDGIHFDYIRYPGVDYSYDPVSLQRYRDPNENPRGLSWSDWQREQVNTFVREFYHRAMEIRPELKVSAAVIGKYNAPWTGWDGYNVVYQDAKAWAREGTIDLVCPMIYWPIGPDSPAPFEVYLRQWLFDDPVQRPVLAGIGAYKYTTDLAEIVAEIDTCRALGAAGHVMFSYSSLDDPGFWDELVATSYVTLANVPPSPWKDNEPPNPPVNLTLIPQDNGRWLVDWQAPDSALDGDVADYYNVYRSTEVPPMDPFDGKYLLAITVDTTTQFLDTRASSSHKYYYWVTALDDADNESGVAEQGYTAVSATGRDNVPNAWILSSAYPNPFNGSVTIEFGAPSWARNRTVEIAVYDILGRRLRLLAEGTFEPGWHRVQWNGTDERGVAVTSGVYFVRLKCGDFTGTWRVTYIR